MVSSNPCVLAYVDPITLGSNSGVRRGQQPRLNDFTNVVTFRQLSDTPNIKARQGTPPRPPVRDVVLQVSVFVVQAQGDMAADVKCSIIGECIDHCVEGCNFNYDWCTNQDILVYTKNFAGWTGPYYNDSLKCSRMDGNFTFIASVCSYRTPIPMCF